MNNSSSSWSTV